MSLFDGRVPSDGTAAHQYPISRTFALTALAALLILIVLRHVFGGASFSVSGGVK